MLYHGPQPERVKLVKQMRQRQGPLKMCPVVVTSFEMAMRDRKFLQVNGISSSSFLGRRHHLESLMSQMFSFLFLSGCTGTI